MDIRYSTSPADVKRYTTDELRKEFLIENLYEADVVRAVYSHADRMVVFGVMPINEAVPIEKGTTIWESFGVSYLLERREAGFFNLGGDGVCVIDGEEYAMGNKDCVYITMGTREVLFKSVNPNSPAKFYGVSAPAHMSYATRLIKIADAAKKPLGSLEASNRRVINQFIHPDVLPTCQLLMGLTILEEGSVWNTMPAHTHERRMEIYTYFDMKGDGVVFHMMGQPQETRHIVMKNGEAVISPPWSVHSGCGTSSYAFIWAMGGENQAFDDMDVTAPVSLK